MVSDPSRRLDVSAIGARLLTTLESICPILLALLLLANAALGIDTTATSTIWIGSWAASQQLVQPGDALNPNDIRDATLRQIVHLSLGGNEIRLRLSNRFGTTPLHVMSAHVARPASSGSGRILPGTDRTLLFGGLPDVEIPPHADYVSDPLPFAINALSDVAITLHINAPPNEQTGHPGSRTTSYVTHGNFTSAPELPGAKAIEHWYFIAEIDVAASPASSSIVVLGDSITDGHGSTTNGNNRWPDILARRLKSETITQNVGVLNSGISGNRLLSDGLGPNALSRFDHDVLAQSGVRYLIVLEGINDIGMLTRDGAVPLTRHEALTRRMIGAYEQIIARAHSQNIKTIGATILPFVGSDFYHPDPASEADRQAVNTWIRNSGRFDEVIDFDQIMRDPEHPDRLLPAFDSGDHLHPSPIGYAAMAESLPLSLFAAPLESVPEMAITFDDLPAHGPLPLGQSRVEVASRIIAALRDANVPPTYGFVNAVRLDEQPSDAEVLEEWHAAGNPLGNHSWSHMNLNQHSLEDFEQDVLRDEAALARVMKKEDWHWFRYPFLAEGDTPRKMRAFAIFFENMDTRSRP